MNEHTPGPWVITDGPSQQTHHIRPVSEAKKLHLIPIAWVAKLNDGEANARLIAAAPDLLAALKEIAEWDDEAGKLGEDGLPLTLYRTVNALLLRLK